jgi:hypothetical protein
MKLAAIVTAMVVAGAAARAGQPAANLIVYMVGVNMAPRLTWVRGEAMATKMFAGVGVKVEWRHREPAAGQVEREQAIVVRVLETAPAQASHDALAAALPYEGSTVTLYYGSMKWAEPLPELAAALFAHVLTHEITHNLERIDRHSATGVLRAHWTQKDYEEMRMFPLPFAEEDIMWIHKGMDARAARIAAAGTGSIASAKR